MRPGNKDIKAALPPGYTVIARGKHHAVVGPDGQVIRRADGRLLLVPKGGKIPSGSLPRLIEQIRRETS